MLPFSSTVYKSKNCSPQKLVLYLQMSVALSKVYSTSRITDVFLFGKALLFLSRHPHSTVTLLVEVVHARSRLAVRLSHIYTLNYSQFSESTRKITKWGRFFCFFIFHAENSRANDRNYLIFAILVSRYIFLKRW